MIAALFRFLKRILGMQRKNDRVRQHANQGPAATKRLGGETMRLRPLPTVKLSTAELDVSGKSGETPQHLLIEWFGLSDVGSVRDHNEDFFACDAFDNAGLFVIADGMGGHDAGEVASRIAVETVHRVIQDGMEKRKEPLALVRRAVKEANRKVMAEGAAKGSNMGTTLGVALMTEGRAYIASVGDSRAYWVENGAIRQITEDHSLVAKLVAAGKLTKEEARTHPKSNLLYRTIGSEEDVTVDAFQMDLVKGGALLLCTDGLWGEVRDEDIHRVCRAARTAQEAVSRMVRMANENGGKDNITAVMVRIQ